MQFNGKLTEADLTDVQKMTRSKTFWVRFFLANWYAVGLVLAILWATISGIIGQIKPNWGAMSLMWAVIAGIVLWSFHNSKGMQARELKQLNAALPDQISLTNDGVKLDGPDGATGFLPWRNFKGWREGQQVMLVDQCQENRVLKLPVAQLSDTQRLPIRQFLQSRIPPKSQ